MKKKNGFISISAIYAFLIVFLLLMTMIILTYAHNRVNSEIYKNDIKNKYANLEVSLNVQNDELVASIQPSGFYSITSKANYPETWSSNLAREARINISEFERNIQYYFWIKNSEGYSIKKKLIILDSTCENVEEYSNILSCSMEDENCFSQVIYRTRTADTISQNQEYCPDGSFKANESIQRITVHKYLCEYNDGKLKYTTKMGENCLKKYMGYILVRSKQTEIGSKEVKLYDCKKYNAWSKWQSATSNPGVCPSNTDLCEKVTGYCYKGEQVILND